MIYTYWQGCIWYTLTGRGVYDIHLRQGCIWYTLTGRGVYGIHLLAGVYMVYTYWQGCIWYTLTGRGVYGIHLLAGVYMVYTYWQGCRVVHTLTGRGVERMVDIVSNEGSKTPGVKYTSQWRSKQCKTERTNTVLQMCAKKQQQIVTMVA